VEPAPDTDVVIETVPDKSTIKRVTLALNTFKENPAFGRWRTLLYDENSGCRFDSEEILTKASKGVQERFQRLNESQRRAASAVIRAKDIAIIHGRESAS
jgi:hypothetical protein